jgi:hypothetical protein
MAGSVRPSSMNDGRLSDSRRVFAREERVPVRGIVPPDQKDFIKRATLVKNYLLLWVVIVGERVLIIIIGVPYSKSKL